MDKVRIRALQVLFNVLHSPIPLKSKTALLGLFPPALNKDNFSTFGLDSSASFGILAPCLDMDAYRYHALVGLITSVGGMGKNVADTSTKHVVDYVTAASAATRILFLNTINSVFEAHAKNDRIIIPALKTLTSLSEVLWGNAVQDVKCTYEQLAKLIRLCGNEVRASREVPKLSAFLEFAGSLQLCSLSITETRSLMAILLSLLSHRYHSNVATRISFL